MIQLKVFKASLKVWLLQKKEKRRVGKKGEKKGRRRKRERETSNTCYPGKNYLIGFVLSAVFKLSIVLLLSSSSSFSKARRDFLYAKKTEVTSSNSMI